MTIAEYNDFLNYLGEEHPHQLVICKFSLVDGNIEMKIRSRLKISYKQPHQSYLSILDKWAEDNRL
jgi:hypothetical protein